MKSLVKLFLFSLISFFSYAAVAGPAGAQGQLEQAQMEARMKAVQDHEQALEEEIATIKAELKKERAAKARAKVSRASTPANKNSLNDQGPMPPMPALMPSVRGAPVSNRVPTSSWINSSSVPEEEKTAEALQMGRAPYGDFGPARFTKGITVTTSPLLGVRTAFDASDLLYQYPSMNEDLILLRQRQYFEYLLRSVGDTLNNRSILMISGALEGELLYDKDFDGQENDDINLATAALNFAPFISRYAGGFIALNYDSSPPATGSRVTNSRIYLSRGFLTLGNLDSSPVYFTIGQIYAPFGRYSSAMLTTPLTLSLARLEVRAAELGVFKNGFYGQLYGFMGNKTSGLDRIARQGGVNAGYQTGSLDIGAGYVSNIADSQGMQNNGIDPISVAFGASNVRQSSLTQFGGFGVTPNGNALARSVPALDWHMEFSHGPMTVLTEFIAATSRFSPVDLTFYTNAGAAVKACHFEVDFTKHFGRIPMTIGFIYGQTWQALALNLPKNTYAAVISTSLWKNTMIGLEYRHDINYGVMAANSATGAQLPVTSANIGGTRDMVTLQLGAYF